jgi:hypothetical protein
MAAIAQRCNSRLDNIFDVAQRREQQAGVLPKRFRSRVTGDALAGRVGFNNAMLGIRDKDAFGRAVQNAGRQTQTTFGDRQTLLHIQFSQRTLNSTRQTIKKRVILDQIIQSPPAHEVHCYMLIARPGGHNKRRLLESAFGNALQQIDGVGIRQ